MTIKAPPEVGYLFSDSGSLCAFDAIVLWSHVSTPRVVAGYHTETFSAWLETHETDQCLWCRYSDDGELKGVIGIHVDDFLIGLADGILGEKWMSEIKSLYRWGS